MPGPSLHNPIPRPGRRKLTPYLGSLIPTYHKAMKATLIVSLILLVSSPLFSQNLGASVNAAGNPPDPSAIFDASSQNQGLLLPRMTTSERDAIISPATSLLIFNTTTNCFETYVNNVWQSIWCSCTTPAAPGAAVHSATPESITWNWNAVSGALGYKWNTLDDYSSASDLGNVLSYAQSGLVCNTPASIYVWSYNICGHSTASMMSATTAECPFICGTPVTFTYRGNTVTYGTVSGAYNAGEHCWMDRNLGASQVATSSADALSYGDLFQWGRADDGHQLRTSAVSAGPVTSALPGNNYISNSSSPQNWYNGTSPGPEDFWQGVSGINNPCPSGFRLPTATELNHEMGGFSTQNAAGAFASPLKLPVAGYRNYDGSAPADAGSRAYYWSSTVYGSQQWSNLLVFGSGYANMDNFNQRAYGHSVRCIKD